MYTEIQEHFYNIIRNEKDVSAGVAAIASLLKVLEKSKCKCRSFFNLNDCVKI